MAKLSFFGGVGEIGGNKILVEDRDARIWLDMGAPFDLGEEYFVEFLQPRERFGLRDYFALDLMKRIPGLYSSEALDPTDMAWEPPAFSAIPPPKPAATTTRPSMSARRSASGPKSP